MSSQVLYDLYIAYSKQVGLEVRFNQDDLYTDIYNRFNNRPVSIDFIQRIVRTNFFDRNIHDPLVVKLTGIDFLYEFFVYHEDFEGVYIKEGLIARGGIRLSSDEFYRNEALALYRTQALKNSCIVPQAGKGCFIHKKGEEKSSYLRFIKSILDITDDVQNGKIIKYQYALDEYDTYFVVAPDKGTGYWLDDANELSKNRWIGNAFASSSNQTGLSHKKLGITSKGAWISAQYHFKKTDIDINNISTIGVGDMSGDVFGNGMLLSRNIKLYAAFNHSEIFIDIAPDNTSYDERKRLFDNQLTWKHYIGKYVYVYDRNVHIIHINSHIQKLLNIHTLQVTPDDLIRSILTMKVDMIWFGGIGTYISCNGPIKPNEIQAKVIIEGANLAVTQEARTQLTCLINTDYFDNSGGVQCSDYEVILKTMHINDVQSLATNVEKIILENHHEQNILLDYLEENRHLITEDMLNKLDIERYNAELSRSELCEFIARTRKYLKSQESFIELDSTAEYILNLKIPMANKYIEQLRQHVFIQDILRTLYINYAIRYSIFELLNEEHTLSEVVHQLTKEYTSI